MKKLSYAEIVEILDFFQINIWYELSMDLKQNQKNYEFTISNC